LNTSSEKQSTFRYGSLYRIFG